MTVQTETSRSGPYAGSGTTGPFTVGFRFLDNTHLQVIRTSVGGIDTTLVVTTDYSVSGAGGSSGTVTLVTALASGERLTIIRDVPFTQLADYVDNDAFPAESHENALDLLTMQTQQNKETLDRALTLPATATSVSTELPIPEAGKVIGWNSTATELQNLDVGTLASIVAYGTAVGDLFSGTGAQTAFTLTQDPASINNLDVSIGGVAQRPGIDYAWSSGTTLTFATAPVAGTNNILVRYMQALAMGSGSASDIQYLPAGTGAVATTVQTKLRESVSVKDFGAVGDGVANDTAEFALARAVTNRYHIPTGSYVLDASPDPFLDCFTSGNGVTLIVGGVSYDCSNAFAGPLRYVAASATKTNIVHAKTGNVIQYWQDGGEGTATGFYRGLAFTTDSHWVQAQPSTNGGSTDILWQRSTLNADPGGNRFNETFDEANDRLLFSYATTASGSPSFDTFFRCYAGTAAAIDFPALAPTFKQGWSMQNRAETGYKMSFVIGTDRHHIKDFAGTFTHMTFKSDGAVGFFGSGGVTRPTVTGSRGGNAALASALTALSQLGLITDSTTA